MILSLLNDKDWMVRAEAAVTLANLGVNNSVRRIEKAILSSNKEEKVRYFYSLTKLGKFWYLALFLNNLFHEYYRIRCATVNLCSSIINEYNKDFIKNLLLCVLQNEKSEAVKSSIACALKKMKIYSAHRQTRTR